MATTSYPTNQTCLWCSQPLIGFQQTQDCAKHTICDKCTFKNCLCQSRCPCCWYDNGTSYVSKYNICPACGNQFVPSDNSPLCYHQHKHCLQCSPGNCNLCKLVQLRSMVNNSNFENLPADWHPILHACHSIEQKFEELQQMDSNNPNASLQRQQTAEMGTMNNSATAANSTTTNNICVICLENLDATSVMLPTCQHHFHQVCIEQWFQSSGKQSCPTCGHLYGISKGPQPALGEMRINYLSTPLPGFTNEQYAVNEGATIEITYTIPSGIQGPLNPFPGQPFTGTNRKAYLPNNQEGKYILQLLRRAFDDQHVFTIGKSVTTGADNVVVWNDIHHKTSISGGPENFGYPDPTYLLRVRQELADKGYK